MTPTTSLIVRLSNIDMNPHVRPKLAAAKVLFATDEYGYSHFREFEFFNSRTQRLGLNLGGSSDIMSNLPKYIKGMVSHWDVGEAVDYAVPHTKRSANIYVYKYKWVTPQQGCRRCKPAGGASSAARCDVSMENRLWLLVSYSDRTDFLQIFADELEDESEGSIHLDRMIMFPECNTDFNTTNNVTATYNSETKKTTFVLPYTSTGKTFAVVRFVNAKNQGAILGSTTGDTIACDAPGDWTQEKIAFGEEYEFRMSSLEPLSHSETRQGTV